MAKTSKTSNLIPLLVLFVVLCVLGAVGFVVYSITQDITNKTKQKMEQKNIKFSKEGMRVGVKDVSTERYEDNTQNLLVKMWNNASFKGRFDSWGTPTGSTMNSTAAAPGVGTEKRKPFLRSPSGQGNIKKS